MERSESIAALAAALSKAQSTIQGAIKDTANPFFKSKYADLASVKDAIQVPLSSNGLAYVQVVHNPENGVGVETILMHASGEWLSGGVVFVPVSKADAQGYGSALTYARRYSLSAITGVAPEDDDGIAAAKAKPAEIVKSVPKAVIDKMSDEEREFLVNIANEIKIPLAANESVAACELYEHHKAKLDVDEQVALWALFDSKQRSEIKKGGEYLKQQKEKQ